MKPTHLLDGSHPITKSSVKDIYIDKTDSSDVVTSIQLLDKTTKRNKHSEFDELLKEWKQEGNGDLKEARNWVADSFYSEDGDTVRTLRLRKGWSQTQLAEAMGTVQPHITRIERGTENLLHTTMIKLAEALDIDMNSLSEALIHQDKIYKQKNNGKN